MTLIRQYYINFHLLTKQDNGFVTLTSKGTSIEIPLDKNFKKVALAIFWFAVEKEYPILSSISVQYLL